MYNPFSLLNALSDRRLGSYWTGDGLPSCLVEMFRKFNTLPSKVGTTETTDHIFYAPLQLMYDITPMLYQTGYLTIKDSDKDSWFYTLDIPNSEVRTSLMDSKLP